MQFIKAVNQYLNSVIAQDTIMKFIVTSLTVIKIYPLQKENKIMFFEANYHY